MRRSWQPDSGRVGRALDTLRWRGPDGSTLEAHGDWWLGVARLTITDPTAGQPLRCPRTGRVTILNGAVTSAAREWGEVGERAQTRNDAELALHRLERAGPPGLGATCGPYALAVLDPGSGELWLARDPEGEKPLWVALQRGRVVAFASSLAALQVLGIAAVWPATEFARLLRFGFCRGPQAAGEFTLRGDLHGVWSVDAADGTLHQVRHDDPPQARSTSGFRDRVLHAVARCRRAEVPVALALSGGVDSSCLAAALHALDQPCPAYQFRATQTSDEERARAVAVAQHTHLELRQVDGGPEVLDALPDLTAMTGFPQGDPSLLAMHALARAAATDGVRVLLSGEGADEQWLGYRRHRAARWLPRRGFARLPAPQLAMSTRARLARAVRAADPYAELLAVTPPGFATAVLVDTDLRRGALPETAAGEPTLSRAREIDRRAYLPWDLLRKLDTATMAAGIEGRCPFLDPELTHSPQTCSAAPESLLGKRPLKGAFAGDLPAGVLRRPKRGFGLPLDAWLRGDCLVLDVLAERRTLERPHLRAEGLRDMVDRHRRKNAHLGHPLYLIAALELHLRAAEASA